VSKENSTLGAGARALVCGANAGRAQQIGVIPDAREALGADRRELRRQAAIAHLAFSYDCGSLRCRFRLGRGRVLPHSIRDENRIQNVEDELARVLRDVSLDNVDVLVCVHGDDIAILYEDGVVGSPRGDVRRRLQYLVGREISCENLHVGND